MKNGHDTILISVTFLDLRHTCEQSDSIESYGWTTYDARTGGTHRVYDAGNMVDISTELVKVPQDDGTNYDVSKT